MQPTSLGQAILKHWSLKQRYALLQSHARRWVAHALRSTKLLKTFSKDLLKAKGEGGTWLTVVNFLVVRSFALEVKPWSGNNVPANLRQMLFSILTRKDKVPRLKFHPSRSRSWLREERSQLAAPSGPGPHVLPSHYQ